MTGTAGDGVISAAELFHETAAALGIHTSLYKSIPSSIRSGITTATISLWNNTISSPVGNAHCMALFTHSDSALSDFASQQVYVNSYVFDLSGSSTKLPSSFARQITTVPVATLKPDSSPLFFIGILANLTDIAPEQFNEILHCKHASRKQRLQSALADIANGYSWAKSVPTTVPVPSFLRSDKILTTINGNDALSSGAIDAGCRFFASYPISPATTIGDSLSVNLPEIQGVAYQAEDEIAAIGAVTGASFSGVKAMTATSGPGFSLMHEFISYLSAVELPAVIVDVQRAGPSTGIPTHHAQEDLLSAVFGGHGECSRIVLAPSSIENCYHTTIDAFNCAEQYATPVIILSSCAFASASVTLQQGTQLHPQVPILQRKSVPDTNMDESFQRYTNENSTSPVLPSPGDLHPYRVTGLEHDHAADPSESSAMHQYQTLRRELKLQTIEHDYAHLIEWDLEKASSYNADFSIVAWGADVPAVKTAVRILRKKGYSIAAVFPQILFPVCHNMFEKLLDYSYLLIIPESNSSGQFSKLVRMHSGFSPVSLPFSNGEPINPDILETEIASLVLKRHKND